MDVKDAWNQWADEEWYRRDRTEAAIGRIVERPASAFHPVVFRLLSEVVGPWEGKNVLVPSSGDNHAAFAFHLLGAKVTSTDIAERQLKHAETIAAQHGWAVEFHQADTMTLSGEPDGAYDLVYTSNGVHMWIGDLGAMYGAVRRVLKPHGHYVLFEMHPFTRPFGDDTTRLTVVRPYGSLGPVGDPPRYLWRLQDIVNAMISAHLRVERLEEFFAERDTYWYESDGGRSSLSAEEIDRLDDWTRNPLKAIPQWLAVLAAPTEGSMKASSTDSTDS